MSAQGSRGRPRSPQTAAGFSLPSPLKVGPQGAPAVDVVIVSWNVRSELLDCLDSIRASRGVEPRITVVDNASSDGSAEAVSQRFPDIHLIRNRANFGFARATNQGISAGTAPWVFLLNPDTIVPACAIASLVNRLDALPEHGMIVPRLIDGAGDLQPSVYLLPSIGVALLLLTGIDRLLRPKHKQHLLFWGDWKYDRERDVPWAIGAAMLVRRSVIDRVGLMDESFFVYVEDMEWCDRMWSAGYRVGFTPTVTIVHLGDRSGAQRFGSLRTRECMRNGARFVRRRHGLVWAATYLTLWGAAACLRTPILYVGSRLRPSPERRGAFVYWREQARVCVDAFLEGVVRARRRVTTDGGESTAFVQETKSFD